MVRLLNQLDGRHGSLSATVSRYDIHVYCDGDCDKLKTKFHHVNFHRLSSSATANQSRAGEHLGFKKIEKPLKFENFFKPRFSNT